MTLRQEVRERLLHTGRYNTQSIKGLLDYGDMLIFMRLTTQGAIEEFLDEHYEEFMKLYDQEGEELYAGAGNLDYRIVKIGLELVLIVIEEELINVAC